LTSLESLREVSGNHAQFRLIAHPSRDPNPLVDGGFEVLEILLEGTLVELREEFGLDGRVQLTDFFDELTFGHRVLTFELGRCAAFSRISGGSCEVCIGTRASQT